MPNIFQFTDFRKFLLEDYEEKKAKKKVFSMRNFASRLNLSPSFVHNVIYHNKKLSIKSATDITNRLKLPPPEAEYFVALVEMEKTNDAKKVNRLRETNGHPWVDVPLEGIDSLEFNDFVLLCQLGLLKKIEATPADAERVGHEAEALWSACERLAAGGWIEGNREQGWSCSLSHIVAHSGKAENRRIFHKKYILSAIHAIQLPVEERYFNSNLMSLNRSDYEELCQHIDQFVLERTKSYSLDSTHDSIYGLGIQLIPFARVEQSVSPILSGD